MNLLDPRVISQLDSLSVKARVIVDGALSGLHRARLHGSSVEFADHKEYSPGDEVRHIDWKAYAKADRYYIKRFEQEAELSSYLVLDASGSMGYRGAGLSKLEYAAYLCAAIAYLLIRQHDKVGLLIYGDERRECYVPSRARPAHLADLLRVIEDQLRAGAGGSETAQPALERLADLARRRRSLIVMVSDLFDGSPALTTLAQLATSRHDVVLMQVLDDDELGFPFEGMTLFESLEGPQRLLVNPGAVRRQYLRRLAQFLDGVRDTCLASGIDYHRVPTSRPLERSLLDLLVRRAGATGGTAGQADPWTSSPR